MENVKRIVQRYTLWDKETGECLSTYLCAPKKGEPCIYYGSDAVTQAALIVAVCHLEDRVKSSGDKMTDAEAEAEFTAFLNRIERRRLVEIEQIAVQAA